MMNTIRMIRRGNVLRSLFLPRLVAALVLMFLVSAALPARAQLLFTLDQPLRMALPGDTLLFSGSLTNIGPQELFLNADTFNLTGTNLTLDDSPFLTNFPLSLASGEVASGQMFSIAIGANATGGVYPGSFTIIGGSTDSSFNSLATQNFQVSIAAPEPGTLALPSMTAMPLLLILRKRRSRNNRPSGH